jgi:hypothetical protein
MLPPAWSDPARTLRNEGASIDFYLTSGTVEKSRGFGGGPNPAGSTQVRRLTPENIGSASTKVKPQKLNELFRKT